MSQALPTAPATPSRLGAFVHGYPAVVLGDLLARHGPDQLARLDQATQRGAIPPELRGEFLQAWRDIRAAASEWVDRQAGSRPAAAAAGDSDSSPVTAVDAGSGVEIDTDRAADLLRITPNRIRQRLRCGDLAGRKVGRQWLVSLDAVRRHQEM